MEAPIEILHQNILLSKTKKEIEVIVTEGGAEERESPYSRTSFLHFDRKKAAEKIGDDILITGDIVDLDGIERKVYYHSDQELINAFGGFIGKDIWGDLVFNAKLQDKK